MKNIAVIGAGTMGNGIAHTLRKQNLKYNLQILILQHLKKLLIQYLQI